jgi:hypothetical protein
MEFVCIGPIFSDKKKKKEERWFIYIASIYPVPVDIHCYMPRLYRSGLLISELWTLHYTRPGGNLVSLEFPFELIKMK